MNDPAPSSPRPSAARAILFVVGAGAAFATSGPLARYARPAHPLAIVFGRVAIAALVLLVIDVRGTLQSLRRLDGRQWAGVGLAGLVLAAHFTLFVWGLLTTSLPAAMTLVSLEPLSVVLWAFFVHKARPGRLEMWGIALATIGAVVVASGAGGKGSEHRLAGDLLVVGGVVLYGFYLSVARSLREALPPRQYAGLVYAGCAVVSGIALLFIPGTAEAARWPLPIHSIFAIIGLALVPTLIGHTAVQVAARVAEPALVALVSPGETVGGIVIGMIWLGAIPTIGETIGGAVIVAGVTVAIFGTVGTVEWNPRPPRREKGVVEGRDGL